MERAETVATGMVSDAMREAGADVFNAEAVNEEFAELVDAGQKGGEILAEVVVSQLLKESGILLADHGDARGRGNDDGFGVPIEADEALGLRERFSAEAGVGVHLPATGLLGEEVERDAEALQQAHHGAAGFREEGVVVTGDEERSAHGWSRLLLSVDRRSNRIR